MSLFSQVTLPPESKRPVAKPSLVLDFVNSKVLDPRITYSRASIGTYFNSRGLLSIAPANTPRFDHDPATGECLGLLVEEQRTNLLPYSENLNKWANNGNGILVNPNAHQAPDGSLSATVLAQNTSATGASRWLANVSTSITAGTTYTLSMWMKKISGVDPQPAIILWENNELFSSVGTLTDSWVRYTATFTAATTATTHVGINTTWDSNGAPNDFVFAIWGAQLEVGSFATSYVPSTTSFTSRTTTGTYIGSDGLIKTAAINEARYQYNPLNLSAPPKLLLEQTSVSNLALYSQQLDAAPWVAETVSAGGTLTPNATTAPDGTNTAYLHVPNLNATVNNYRYQQLAVANLNRVISIYAKSAGYNILLGSGTYATGSYAVFDFTSKTFTNIGYSVRETHALELPNGWFRLSIYLNHDPTKYGHLFTAINGTAYSGVNCDGVKGVYVWGAQVELNTTVSSYIPTSAAAAARSADVSSSVTTTRSSDSVSISGANFSSWYRADEGSFTASVIFNPVDFGGAYSNAVLGFYSSAARRANGFEIAANDTTARYKLVSTAVYDSAGIYMGSAQGATIDTGTNYHNIAASYSTSSLALSDNGATAVETALPVGDRGLPTTFVIGMPIDTAYQGFRINGHIRRIAYYNKYLTSTELQTLTTR